MVCNEKNLEKFYWRYNVMERAYKIFTTILYCIGAIIMAIVFVLMVKATLGFTIFGIIASIIVCVGLVLGAVMYTILTIEEIKD